MPPLPCEHCGYDLTGLTAPGRAMTCPECGGTTTPVEFLAPGNRFLAVAVAVILGGAACTGLMFLSVHLGERNASALPAWALAALATTANTLAARAAWKWRRDDMIMSPFMLTVNVATFTGAATLATVTLWHFLGRCANC